jgi:methylaspartate mutase epsilon subunit
MADGTEPAPRSLGDTALAEPAPSPAAVPASAKRTAVDVLREAERTGRVALQPRCGYGGHETMRECLTRLEAEAQPDILSLTIDSFTRLGEFDRARRTLMADPERLNGYPLVAHGSERGMELNEAVEAPLEIRHGSPDARRLFEVAIEAGITSFEGGGIAYNLPYCKDVPLGDSLRAWQEVDRACGDLAGDGVIVDRELFGTLTAVLVPPSISLAVTTLEALAAAAAGVRCLSISYPQGGCAFQDVAALRAIRRLAARYLPAEIEVYPVMHEFMGVFPKDRARADELIFFGALVARLGGATKLITKTNQESSGVPSIEANAEGIRTARLALSDFLDFIAIDEAAVEEETGWIEREVAEIVEPLLGGGDLLVEIERAFAEGRLDIPFSASVHARSEVIPKRDRSGAIRYLIPGGLPFSTAAAARNRRLLEDAPEAETMVAGLLRDINRFEPGGEE